MVYFFTNFPITSLFAFALMMLLAVFFYFVLSLGTELPSSIILASFKRKKRQTFRELLALFTESGLMYQRVDDLVQSKLIEDHSGRFMLTARGTLVWRIIELYYRVFNRRDTG